MTYRGMGRLASRSEAGATLQFLYDTEERLIGIVNEHGDVYRFALGPTGELDMEIGFDGSRRTYRRDLAGRVERTQRASGLEIHYEYDKAGRITRLRYTDPARDTVLGEVRYSYGKDGKLLEAKNSACSVRLERDPLGNIAREISGTHIVTSTYDVRGLRAQLR
jgi:uncharacterized protein RhaS with RHS repeats